MGVNGLQRSIIRTPGEVKASYLEVIFSSLLVRDWACARCEEALAQSVQS
jgi:hypothetical protein